MKFRIKWRNNIQEHGKVNPVITGLTIYDSKEKAQNQVDIWQFLWPNNEYYIEPVRDFTESEWWAMNHD